MSIQEGIIRALQTAGSADADFFSIFTLDAENNYAKVKLGAVEIRPLVSGGTPGKSNIFVAVDASLGTPTEDFGGEVSQRDSTVIIAVAGEDLAYVRVFAIKIGEWLASLEGMTALQAALIENQTELNMAAGTSDSPASVLEVTLNDVTSASTDQFEGYTVLLDVNYTPAGVN